MPKHGKDTRTKGDSKTRKEQFLACSEVETLEIKETRTGGEKKKSLKTSRRGETSLA